VGLSREHQAMMDLVREHEEAERRGDLATTMATLAPYPVYDMLAFGLHFEGMEATRQFYVDFFAGGLEGFQNECLGMWVDDTGVIREDFTNLIDITEFYGFKLAGPRTARFHTVTLFPFENGLIKGERSYFDRATVLEQLGIGIEYVTP
jgi:hypothetical protein